MATPAKRKSSLKRAAPKQRARKAAAGSRGLSPQECLRERAAKFNVDKIKQEDLASTGGARDDAD